MLRFLRLRCLPALAICCVLLGSAIAAPPESVLDRIARTGVLSAGTRDDAPPFAFRDSQGHLVGFSVDLIEEVRKALAKKLGRDVRTDMLVVSPATRLSVIEGHQADLVCETATETWARQQEVDFSLPIFRDGTRVLAYRDTIDRAGDLHDMRIGVMDGSMTGEVLQHKLHNVTLTSFPNAPAALEALESGQIDGVANVGIVLRGMLSQATKRRGLVIVPRGEALDYETIACLLPQNDSRWHNFVNGVLRDLFRGIDQYRGRYVDIYNRWFGRDADIAYPLDDRTVQFFLATLVWLN
jgi:polar amino acid transport system substrate-binding protein